MPFGRTAGLAVPGFFAAGLVAAPALAGFAAAFALVAVPVVDLGFAGDAFGDFGVVDALAASLRCFSATGQLSRGQMGPGIVPTVG